MKALPSSVAERREILRVLLVDPAVDDARLVRELLARREDFRVQSARSLAEAENLLRDGGFDAALVESNWWSDSGGHFVAFLREHRPDVAIVVVTSGENDGEALPALKIGAHDFVSKRNLDGDQLAARLRHAVEESRSLRRRDTMVRWLEREARTDHLSGLHNRRAFDDRLREVCARARSEKSAVTLVMLDIVGTRDVNETYGHTAGDDMIRRVATGISRSIRAVDFAARLGGDDFAIILPGSDLELGRRIARRIAHELERLNATDTEGVVPVSVVFGVASGVAPDSAELFAAGDRQIASYKRSRSGLKYLSRPEDSDGPFVA